MPFLGETLRVFKLLDIGSWQSEVSYVLLMEFSAYPFPQILRE